MIARRAPRAQAGRRVRAFERHRVDLLAQARGERHRLLGELVARILDEDERHGYKTPSSLSTPTTAGAASGPLPST